MNRKNPDPEDIRLAREGWKLAREIISGRKADIVVLDEVNCAMDFGLLPVGEVLETIQGKPDGMELVLTGRGAPPEIIEAADLVTEMRGDPALLREGRGRPRRRGTVKGSSWTGCQRTTFCEGGVK